VLARWWGGERSRSIFRLGVHKYVTLKTEAVFPETFIVNSQTNYSLNNTECCVNGLLLFHQILYVVKLILKSSMIMYLLLFILTSIPGALSDCETVFLHFFDIRAEVEKVKISLRKSSMSKIMKKTGYIVER
jgi:hypothetical protein